MKRQQRVLYYYFLDPQLGLMHVRQETGFPFTVQVYVNGHDWLARQMHQRRLGFVQTDNAFTQLDDPKQAQTLANRFSRLKWINILDRWASAVNPLLDEPWLGKRSTIGLSIRSSSAPMSSLTARRHCKRSFARFWNTPP